LLKEYINEGTFGYVWSAIKFRNRGVSCFKKYLKDQERGDNALSEGIKLIGGDSPSKRYSK